MYPKNTPFSVISDTSYVRICTEMNEIKFSDTCLSSLLTYS